MKVNDRPVLALLSLFVLVAGGLISFSSTTEADLIDNYEEMDLPSIRGFYSNGTINYTYRENPFSITYADPRQIHDIIWDQGNRTVYFACEYGIIIKDLDTGKCEVISEWDGIEFRSEVENCIIDDIEMDWVNSRLFAIPREVDKIYQIDVKSRRIQREYEFDMGVNLLKLGHFRKMAYDHSREVLFIGKDTGLLVFFVETGEIQFYDLHYFDIAYTIKEETENGFKISTEPFTIRDMVFHQGSGKLFIATTSGLSVFDLDHQKIKNYRDDHPLDCPISDIDIVKDTLYIGSFSLITMDLVSGEFIQYQRIKEEGLNYSIISLSSDKNDGMVYACMVSDELSVFKMASFDTIFNRITGIINDTDYLIHRVNPIVYSNPENGLVYMGRGTWSMMGFGWRIEYSYTGKFDIRSLEDGNLVYHMKEYRFIDATSYEREIKDWSSNSGTCTSNIGYPLHTYDPNNGSFRELSICDFGIDSDIAYFRSFIDPDTGKGYAYPDRGRNGIFVFSREGAFEKELIFDSNVQRTHLHGGDLYVRTFNKVYRHVLSNGTTEMILDKETNGLSSCNDTIIIRSSGKVWTYDPDTRSIEIIWSGDVVDICSGNGSIFITSVDSVMEYDIETGALGEIEGWDLSDDEYKWVKFDDANEMLYLLDNKNITRYDPRSDEIHRIECDFNISSFWISLNGSGIIVRDYEFTPNYYFYFLHDDTMEIFKDIDGIKRIEYHEGSDSTIFMYGYMNTRFYSSTGILNDFPQTCTLSNFYIDDRKDLLIAVTGSNRGGFGYSQQYPKGLIIYDLDNGSLINLTRYQGLPSIRNHNIVGDEERGSIHINGEHYYAVLRIEDAYDPIWINEVPTQYVLNISIGQEAEVFGHRNYLEPTYTAAGLMGIISLLGVGIYIFEPSKMALFRLILGPLFSRYKGDRVLRNKRRERMLKIIDKDPGINFSSLKKELGYNIGSLSHHLNYLEREGLIRSRISGIRKKFYASDHGAIDEYDVLSNKQKKILSMIGSEPGISQREISRRSGIPPSTVNYNMKRMEEKGLIEIRPLDGHSACFLGSVQNDITNELSV